MAIYHLHHSTVGRATQRQPHTAAAHVAYISRKKACSVFLAEHAPENGKQAQVWLKDQEDTDRKNARVIDKVTLALPRELSAHERTELVREFASEVTQGRVPWLAAIHDKEGNDRDNPHCHLVIRDRDRQTGKRALYLSAGLKEKKQLAKKGVEPLDTNQLRAKWEAHANLALERAGSNERIDHRTLKEQGIERIPTIHEGVQSRQMEKRGERPVSKIVSLPNAATAKSRMRQVDYRGIDKGKTRSQHNAEIISLAERRKDMGLPEVRETQVRIRQVVNELEVNFRDEWKKRRRKELWKNKKSEKDTGHEPDW